MAVALVSHASIRLHRRASHVASCRCTGRLSCNTKCRIRVVAHRSSRPCTCQLLPMCILQNRIGVCPVPASDDLMRSRRKGNHRTRRVVSHASVCMYERVCLRALALCCDSMRCRHALFLQGPPVVSLRTAFPLILREAQSLTLVPCVAVPHRPACRWTSLRISPDASGGDATACRTRRSSDSSESWRPSRRATASEEQCGKKGIS